jgi:magnesium-transporting ATPase (P-type)
VIDLGSELPPTIAFAYQPSEKDIMKRKPRKLDNRLVGFGILLYAYGFAGITMTVLCVTSYLFVYWYVSKRLISNLKTPYIFFYKSGWLADLWLTFSESADVKVNVP